MARRSDRIEKEVPKYLIFPIRLDRIDLKWGSLSQLHGMFPLGQHPRGHPSLFGHYRRPQTRRYVVNLSPWRPGQQPRPWIQTIAQRTPAVAPQKKSWRSQAQLFHQLDRPSATRTKRSTQNTEEKLKTSIAASLSLSSAWR